MSKIQADSTYHVCGLKINVKKIPFGTRWVKDCPAEGFKKGDLYKADRLMSGGSGRICGVTIHNTDASADAATYTLATFNQNMNSARVHFYVDDKEAWQNLELNEVGWHAGTGNYGKGNEDTVAIEIIMDKRVDFNKDDKTRRAFIHGALLTAYILKITGLTVKDVHTHKEWNGKNCPCYILPDMKLFLQCVEYLLKKLNEKAENYKAENGGRENPIYEMLPSGKVDEMQGVADGNASAEQGLPQVVTPPEISLENKDGMDSAENNNTEQMYEEVDNKPDEYAAEAVQKAVEKGLLIGDGNGNLRLHGCLTRQDLFVILDRMGVLK